jgi:hypothetical protein
MATIHITEIQRIVAERGEKDALPWAKGGFFLEIRFDDPSKSEAVVDHDLRNKTIYADCPFGFVSIRFDQWGMLESIDLS